MKAPQILQGVALGKVRSGQKSSLPAQAPSATLSKGYSSGRTSVLRRAGLSRMKAILRHNDKTKKNPLEELL
jgi:hypothetical protein